MAGHSHVKEKIHSGSSQRDRSARSSDLSSDSSSDHPRNRKNKKHHRRRDEKDQRKKEEKRKLKKLKKKEKKKMKRERVGKCSSTADEESAEQEIGPAPPEHGLGQTMRPMTMQEWQHQSSQLKHVIDPDTGRKRLIRGNGEIVEEIVSAKRHAEINRQATQHDGAVFQQTLNKMTNR